MRKSWVWRRFLVVLRIFPPFLAILFTRQGLFSAEGRQLIWGKVRRTWLSAVPPFARFLQKHYGLSGGCQSCGASCNLLFQCPHWDESTGLCRVYEDRPNICRSFPMTPGDIRDRNLVLKRKPCGFQFKKPAMSPPAGRPDHRPAGDLPLAPVVTSTKLRPYRPHES